jgi:protein SCO1/2
MRTSRHRLLPAAAAAALLVSGCAGTSGDAGPTAATEVEAWHGVEPEPVPDRPSFVLTDTAGDPYDFLAETGGRPTLVYFGYTNCPDECPTAMADIAAALRRSEPDLREEVEVVFVTTDPERDSPEVLRQWLDKFGDGFVGLVGTQEEVDTAQRAVGIRPATDGGPVPTLPGRPNEHEHQPGTTPHTHDGPLGYAVNHTNVIFAYSVDDRLPVLYPAGVTPGDLVADLPRLARKEDRAT